MGSGCLRRPSRPEVDRSAQCVLRTSEPKVRSGGQYVQKRSLDDNWKRKKKKKKWKISLSGCNGDGMANIGADSATSIVEPNTMARRRGAGSSYCDCQSTE
jgi:hypothetical protein